jgi:hypothetical protein
MKQPKLSESGVPTIPMNEPISYEDWLRGRRARREGGELVSRKIIRRESSSNDKRLRAQFDGQRGLPFTPTDKL